MRRTGVLIGVAVLALGACSSAGAESEADNVEAENIVIYAGQLGPDWQQNDDVNLPHGDDFGTTLASSLEARRCFKPRPPIDYTASANGDGMVNSVSGASIANQVTFHEKPVDVDALIAQFSDPSMFTCWREIGERDLARELAKSGEVQISGLASAVVPVSSPPGTRALGIHITGTFHVADGTQVPMRFDFVALFKGRAEAIIVVTAPNAFPEDVEALVVNMIGERMVKADTA